MARKKDEYDWLNDPFDEKKAAREREQAQSGTASKVALGCGCLLIVAAFFVLLAIGAVQVMAALR